MSDGVLLSVPLFLGPNGIFDATWKLNTAPMTLLKIVTASKTSEQLCAIFHSFMTDNAIVGSEKVKIHTVTSDNETSVARCVDLLTNFVGSVRCVVQTSALCVNDVIENDPPWQRQMDHVSSATTKLSLRCLAPLVFYMSCLKHF